MKKRLMNAAAAAALVWTASAQANLLLAPGFEVPAGAGQPGAPDATNANVDAPITAAAQNPWYGPRTGQEGYSSSVNTFSGSAPARNRIGGGFAAGTTPDAAFQGSQYAYAYSVSSTFGYMAQDITGAAVIPGDTYTASAYFNNKAATGSDGDQLNPGQSVDSVRLRFLDSTGALISQSISGDGTTGSYVSGATARNTWTQVTLTDIVAPAGTVTITFQAYVQRGTGSNAGGVMFADSASLVDSTPEPASLGLIAIGGAALLRRRRIV